MAGLFGIQYPPKYFIETFLIKKHKKFAYIKKKLYLCKRF